MWAPLTESWWHPLPVHALCSVGWSAGATRWCGCPCRGTRGRGRRRRRNLPPPPILPHPWRHVATGVPFPRGRPWRPAVAACPSKTERRAGGGHRSLYHHGSGYRPAARPRAATRRRRPAMGCARRDAGAGVGRGAGDTERSSAARPWQSKIHRQAKKRQERREKEKRHQRERERERERERRERERKRPKNIIKKELPP